MIALLDLIGEHEDAFVYDWRERFGVPLEVVFDGRMSWAEAWSLTVTLARDPSSQLGATLAGWQYPAPRDALVLLDLFDLTAQANSGKRKPPPHPRPWDKPPERFGRPAVSQNRVRAALRAAGHDL